MTVLSTGYVFIMFFSLLATGFPMLTPLLSACVLVFETVASILLATTGCEPYRRRELKSGNMHPEMEEGMEEAVTFLTDAIEDMMIAREDPVVGTLYDEQICELADILSEVEGMLGKSGKRRTLKGKSSKGGLSCGSKSGKGYSGKTYSPSPSATVAGKSKSAKGTYEPSDTSYPKSKSAKGTYEPSDTSYPKSKSAKGTYEPSDTSYPKSKSTVTV